MCSPIYDTRENRRLGEVTVEHFFVDSDILDADDPLIGFKLYDPIHQQERISMGQVFLYFCYVHAYFLISLRLETSQSFQHFIEFTETNNAALPFIASHQSGS